MESDTLIKVNYAAPENTDGTFSNGLLYAPFHMAKITYTYYTKYRVWLCFAEILTLLNVQNVRISVIVKHSIYVASLAVNNGLFIVQIRNKHWRL